MLSWKRNVFLIAGFLVLFGIGFFVGKFSVVCEVCPPQDVNFSLFWEVWQELKEKYVDPGKIDVQKMIYGAISGMVKSVGDPYTSFFNPEETEIFLEDISGSFEGVGMEIGIRKGQLQVVSPIEGTPAQEAGLRPGDKILKIDDRMTVDITTEEAVSLIRGPKGTEVVLTIFRDEWNLPKEFKIKRDVIIVPSLTLKFFDFEGKEGDTKEIAYIKIHQFSQSINSSFAEAALKILNSPAKKIILDLRSNPGGYLEMSQEVAGWFLEKGQTVVIQDFGGKKEQILYKARGNAKFLDYPVVILINQGSASASEILASALRDNRDIKLIGEKSFGKGSVQELEEFKDRSSLKVTTANWLTPKGQLISEIGLEPDIKVELSEEDYNEGKDPQLEKAIEIINEIK